MNATATFLRRIVTPGAFLLTMMLASQASSADEYVKSYTLTGPAKVRVKVDDSSVRVITSDTNQVEFKVTSEGFALISTGGKVHVDSQQNGNEVELTVQRSPQFTFFLNTKRLFTEVRMPKNADLQLETSDGHVELADLNGNIVVHTSDGAIRASQLSGLVDLHSNDGDITAEALTGTFKLHSGDGKISATGLNGKCEISTRDGPIHVAGRFDSLDLKSSDGAVTARAEPGSKMASAWNIATDDGQVDVDIPKDLQANLDASTRDGHISLGLPVSMQGDIVKKAVHGAINGGGPLLYIHTGDGSIRLNAL
jgi:DUF4097 and DUF4098 domain-containing protein YvlB